LDSSAGAVLNLADGAGDDVTISHGGIFQIPGTHSYSTTVVYSGSADINVLTGGRITVVDGTAATLGEVSGQVGGRTGQGNGHGTGTKTFRNGIVGSASITQTSTETFSVNGATAQLGGAGSISLNAAGALTIGGTTTATLTSNKQIDTGTITVNGTLNCDANA